MPDVEMWRKRILLTLLPLALLLLLEAALHVSDAACPTSFLLRETIQGQSRFVDNPCFGYRFFPRRMARMGAPLSVAVDKPKDHIRIVVLGGSAIQGEPLPECGPVPRLLARLQAANPDRHIEVINAALTGVNSYAVRVIAHEIYALHPDLLVVYTGHNEFISTGGPHQWPAWTRLSVAASSLRIAGWLGTSASPDNWSGLLYFTRRETEAGSAGEKRVYTGFQHNLESILEEAGDHQVPVLLCTLASNTADEPPFGHRPTAATPESMDGVSLDTLRGLAGEHPKNAMIYYLLGNRLWEANQKPEAAHAWTHARDLDRLRLRADSHLNNRLRTIADRYEHVRLLDVERIFNDQAERGVPGSELFDDHVHFSARGNALLASYLAGTVADQLKLNLPSRTGPATLELSPWNQADRIDALIRRGLQHPFTGRPGNLARLEELYAEREACQRQPVDLNHWREVLLQRAERTPFDPVPPASWGRILSTQGHQQEAIAILQHATRLAPLRADIFGLLTLAMTLNNETQAGIDQLVDTLPDHTRLHKASALLQVAQELKALHRIEDAGLCLQAAHNLDPDNRILTFEQVANLTSRGEYKQAFKLIHAWIRKHPSDGDARDEEAAIFVAEDNYRAAEQVLRATMRRMPKRPETPLRLALLLRLQGRQEDEINILRELVAAHPTYPQGHYELGRCLVRLGQPEQARILFKRALACTDAAPLAPAIKTSLQRLPHP